MMNLNLGVLKKQDTIEPMDISVQDAYYQLIIDKEAQRDATEQIIALLKTCGKTTSVEQYLSDTVADFESISLSSISETELLDMLNKNLDTLDREIAVAYEGWINNVTQTIIHTFKADSKVAALISESIERWKQVDAKEIEEKVIDFKLLKYDVLKTGVNYLSSWFKNIKDCAADLRESSKWFHGDLSSDQCKSLLDKMNAKGKKFRAATESELNKFNDMLIRKSAKGKTFKDAGFTKASIINLLQFYSSNIAGLLNQIKSIQSLLSSFGSEYHVSLGADTDGNLIVMIDKEVKAQYRKLYDLALDVYNKYDTIDYCMFRLAKEV